MHEHPEALLISDVNIFLLFPPLPLLYQGLSGPQKILSYPFYRIWQMCQLAASQMHNPMRESLARLWLSPMRGCPGHKRLVDFPESCCSFTTLAVHVLATKCWALSLLLTRKAAGWKGNAVVLSPRSRRCKPGTCILSLRLRGFSPVVQRQACEASRCVCECEAFDSALRWTGSLSGVWPRLRPVMCRFVRYFVQPAWHQQPYSLHSKSPTSNLFSYSDMFTLSLDF